MPKAIKPMTKMEIVKTLAANTGLSGTKITEVFDHLLALGEGEMRSKGVFNVPGFVRLKRVEQAARSERKGRSPKDGSEIIIPARGARKIVRAKPYAEMQDAVGR